MTIKEILYILNNENTRRILKYKRKYIRFIIFPSYVDSEFGNYVVEKTKRAKVLCVTDLLVGEFHGGFKQFRKLAQKFPLHYKTIKM